MSELKIGTPVSPPTNKTSRPRATAWKLGVPADRIYVDHGQTGTALARAGLREASLHVALVTPSL